MIRIGTEGPDVPAGERVRRQVGDEIVLNRAPESTSDDEVDIGVVAERAVVDVTLIAVPTRSTHLPIGHPPPTCHGRYP